MKGMRNQYDQASSFLVAEQIALESVDQKIDKAGEVARAQVQAEYEPQINAIQEKMNAFFNTIGDEEKKGHFECIENNSSATT
jgi:methanogenic corrinoid protein MtbC1